MRTLVIGASGYIGSRAIPELLARDHEVIAGARHIAALDQFGWRQDVIPVEVDVLDPASVDDALTTKPDAILYLVHGMGGNNFREVDRSAAEHVRTLAHKHHTARIVYVSGIIPPVEHSQLSEHLTSRLEVERILSSVSATVITLRAAMVMGAGSTSFELMAQLATRLPVTVVPSWMHSKVEPIAVSDLVQAIAGALENDLETRNYDVGGGESLPYPELIERYTEVAGVKRPQMTLPLLPEPLVAQAAALIADIPAPTVKALMESLQEDMVAANHEWAGDLVEKDFRAMSVDTMLRRAVGVDGPTL